MVIELDEMWHYLKKAQPAVDLEGLGSCYRAAVGRGVRRAVDAATLKRLLTRLQRWKTRLYCADDYAAYNALIPTGRLYVGKSLPRT